MCCGTAAAAAAAANSAQRRQATGCAFRAVAARRASSDSTRGSLAGGKLGSSGTVVEHQASQPSRAARAASHSTPRAAGEHQVAINRADQAVQLADARRVLVAAWSSKHMQYCGAQLAPARPRRLEAYIARPADAAPMLLPTRQAQGEKAAARNQRQSGDSAGTAALERCSRRSQRCRRACCCWCRTPGSPCHATSETLPPPPRTQNLDGPTLSWPEYVITCFRA